MPHDVFVSHSTKDKIAADALVAHLERDGLRCWCAPRDILPGATWATAIIQAITGAKVMVVIFSQNANTSDHIRREVERAVSHGIPIVPVRIEDVLPAGDLEYFLSSSHWMDAITPPVERHFDNLADRLRHLTGSEAAAPVAKVPSRRPVAKAGGKGKYAAIALGVILAVGVAVLMWHHLGGGRAAPSGPAAAGDADVAADYAQWQHMAMITWQNSFFIEHAPTRFAVWKAAADKKDQVGEFLAGKSYSEGIGVRKDARQAVEYFSASAKQGNTDAMVALAYALQNGEGTTADAGQAYRWATDAADKQNALACVFLGNLFEPSSAILLAPTIALAQGKNILKADHAQAVRYFEKAANLGSGDAALVLGESELVGKTEAAKWLEKAVHQMNPVAILLWTCEHSKDISKKGEGLLSFSLPEYNFTPAQLSDLDQAIKMANVRLLGFGAAVFRRSIPNTVVRLRQVADLPCGEACEALGFLEDARSPQGSVEAIRWFSKAGDEGDASGYRQVANFYKNGTGVPADIHAAIAWLIKAGEPEDLSEIAGIYYSGQDTVRDVPGAIDLWKKAGRPPDFEHIGDAYATGEGIEKSIPQAIEWWTKAGQFRKIGDVYADGKDVARDPQKALEWWKKAAEFQSDYYPQDQSQLYLAQEYLKGERIPQDFNAAFGWLSRAVANNNFDAMTALGNLYRDGTGTTQDYGAALHWYLKATEHYQSGAASAISDLYKRGLGVPQSDAMAQDWGNAAGGFLGPSPEAALAVANDLAQLAAQPNVDAEVRPAEAYWYWRAASGKKGGTAAMRELAKLLDAGVTSEAFTTPEIAEKWWTMAADAGDPEALTHLHRDK